MESRELAVHGALEFTSTTFSDDRGMFVAPFQQAAFEKANGDPLFRVAQTNHSKSRRGVVRGVHYTVTPPGTAKYVYCSSGRSLDIVVDIRVGSPTFGRWDSVLLDQVDFRSVYLPIGVGHAFVALTDSTVMTYLTSSVYVAENEKALSPLDPAMGLPIPADIEPVLSERDTVAYTLDQARERGLLPDYERCREQEELLAAGSVPERGRTGVRP